MDMPKSIKAWMQHIDDVALAADAHEVWKAVAGSPYAGFSFERLSPSQARALMGFFPATRQQAAANVLNAVRTWALRETDGAAEPLFSPRKR